MSKHQFMAQLALTYLLKKNIDYEDFNTVHKLAVRSALAFASLYAQLRYPRGNRGGQLTVQRAQFGPKVDVDTHYGYHHEFIRIDRYHNLKRQVKQHRACLEKHTH